MDTEKKYKIVSEFKHLFEMAKEIIRDEQTILALLENPELAISQPDPQVKCIGAMLYTSFSALKSLKLIPVDATGKAVLMEQTDTHLVFYREYNGSIVKYYVNKETGEFQIDAGSALEAIGIDNMKEFLKTDMGLDAINQFKETHPDIPLFGQDGLLKQFKDSGLDN